MALPKTAKRRYNVRSNSSSSSLDSLENNAAETGYVSDNSASDSEVVYYDLQERNEQIESGFKMPTVLKREFSLSCNQGKRFKADEEGTHTSGRRPKCFSKNAVNARLNRIKKKQHVEDIEKQLAAVSEENCKLKEEAEKRDFVVEELTTELQYLKAIIANSKEIGVLVKAVRNSGLPVASSLNKAFCGVKDSALGSLQENSVFSPMRESNSDSQDPFLPCAGGIDPSPSNELFPQDLASDVLQPFPDLDLSADVGICLHVAQKSVSLEFCAHCNKRALMPWEEETAR